MNDLDKQIRNARLKGFEPGACYQRDDGTVMVEILPGRFVNEAAAQKLGVKATEDRF